MLPVLLLAALTTATAQLSQGCAQRFSQCDGQKWPYQVCCVDPDFECKPTTPYVSICTPKPAVLIGPYGQCGGLGFGGSSRCVASWVCLEVNPYYSHCVPESTIPSLTIQTTSNETEAPIEGSRYLRSAADCDEDEEILEETGTINGNVTNTTEYLEPASEVGTFIVPFAQCGGHGWTGQTICVEGFYCQSQSDWYSQCIPIPDLPGIQVYGQCGGKLWTGDVDCQAGSYCAVLSEWYSQCLPVFPH